MVAPLVVTSEARGKSAELKHRGGCHRVQGSFQVRAREFKHCDGCFLEPSLQSHWNLTCGLACRSGHTQTPYRKRFPLRGRPDGLNVYRGVCSGPSLGTSRRAGSPRDGRTDTERLQLGGIDHEKQAVSDWSGM